MPRKQCVTILGTGNALATKCYNTCFVIHTEGKTALMVDAGGGNGNIVTARKSKNIYRVQ